MGNQNNKVGRNDTPDILQDDITFDIAAVLGTDVLGTKTGKLYPVADIKNIVLARGAKFSEGGSLFALTDEIQNIEMDLKAINGEGFNEGDPLQPVVAATSDGSYFNNGAWSNIDTSGGRDEKTQDGVTTTIEQIFVENGSIVTLHVEFYRP